ncbi:MAG: NAD-dependent epimerase/dehydratase family protein, partial [Methanobrevibacter sp.]|nr:NAD-dependent epimerase/dehydratase family protein [Methanobrevibacter sp.]
LRYFNVFGPKQDPNSQYAAVIPKFIDALMNKQQAIIYGDGEQTRDFIYVKDIVKGNIQSAKSKFNGILNLASGKSISVNQLYEIMKKALNSDLEAIYKEERAGDIKHSLANVDNLYKIDFKVDSSQFENQLKTTVNWFKNHR